MGRLVLGIALVGGASCGPMERFACAQDEQCGAGGRCEIDGNCSFPDGACPSGRRYGEHGAADLAGSCVEAPNSSSDGSTTLVPPGGSSSSSGAEDTLAVGDSGDESGGPLPPEGTSSSGGPGGPTTGDTGAVPTFTFFDDFERPDADAIGNGWWEKTPSAFRIEGGRVARVESTSGYPNNLVLRPEAETPRDVELEIRIHPLMVSPLGHPQIHARVQPDDVEVSGSVTCYLLYVDNADLLQVTRQEAGVFAEELSEPFPTPLELGAVYRLRMRIEGEDPVTIDGWLERQTRDGAWEVHTEIHWADAAPTRIAAPGRLGFSAHTELEHFLYDDFAYTSLDP